LKHKGKKRYRNNHGTIYRVTPSYRLRRLVQQRKSMRKLEAKLAT
jgi:hypothetical protein